LIFDQRLPGLRGVKRCSQCSSSSLPFWPSIQPKQSAISSASGYDSPGVPEPFLAILSHTPGELA
jgi:hypothetical protein